MPAERFSEMVRCTRMLALHLINVPQSASPASGVPVITMKSFTPFLTKIEKVRGSFALPESVDCIDSAPLISTPSRVMMPA